VIEYTILFPSRQRTEKLSALLDSIAETADDLSRVEVLVAVDVDDKETLAWLSPTSHDQLDEGLVLSGKWPFALKFLIMKRAVNFSQEYYSRLYRFSAGRYIMALNDDVCFLTKGWDTLALKTLDAFKARFADGCVLGKCDDGYKARYPCFPVLSREAVEITRGCQWRGWNAEQPYYFHPGFTAWGADIHICRLWDSYPLKRMVELPFVVDHVSHHNHPELKADEVHERMKRMSTYSHEAGPAEARRIREKIEGGWRL